MPRFQRRLRAQRADSDVSASEGDGSVVEKSFRSVREYDMADPIDVDPSDDQEEVGEEEDEEDFDDDEESEAIENIEDSDEDPEEIADNKSFNDDLRNISFGALASAQDSLRSQHKTSKNRSNNITTDPSSRTDAEKVNALRDRLAQLKALKERRSNPASTAILSSNRTSRTNHSRADSPSETTTSTRASKHAPTTQSSKHQVTRRRTIIPAPLNPTHTRDPRFLAGRTTLSTLPASETARFQHNYSFLDDYRAHETTELRTALTSIKAVAKKRRSGQLTEAEAAEKARLERVVQASENRVKADAARNRMQAVVREHRKQEREAVKQGKTPFFLKQSEIKKKVLEERWKGMKSGEKDKAVKRRRKKMSERERRAMPAERRVQ